MKEIVVIGKDIPDQRGLSETHSIGRESSQSVLGKFEGSLGERMKAGELSRTEVGLVGALSNLYDAKYQGMLSQSLLDQSGDIAGQAREDLTKNAKVQRDKVNRYRNLFSMPDVFISEQDRPFYAAMGELATIGDQVSEEKDSIDQARALKTYFKFKHVTLDAMQLDEVTDQSHEGIIKPLDFFIDLHAKLDEYPPVDNQGKIYSMALNDITNYYRARSRVEEIELRTTAGIDISPIEAYAPTYKQLSANSLAQKEKHERRYRHNLKGRELPTDADDRQYGAIYDTWLDAQDELELSIRDNIYQMDTMPPVELHDFAVTVALRELFDQLKNTHSPAENKSTVDHDTIEGFLVFVPPENQAKTQALFNNVKAE